MDRAEAPAVEPGDTAKAAACAYLESLLNKNIRIHTTDTRMFRGEFKCTDPDRNVVLSHTYEYRQPSEEQRAAQAAAAGIGSSDKITMDMTARYLGLIVVPGQYIVKIELEEFSSQVRRQLAS